MSKETTFFIYLIERYAEKKEKRAAQVLKEWDKLGLTDFIYDMYEIYHVERLQNAFEDIDELVLEKQNNTQKNQEILPEKDIYIRKDG